MVHSHQGWVTEFDCKVDSSNASDNASVNTKNWCIITLRIPNVNIKQQDV